MILTRDFIYKFYEKLKSAAETSLRHRIYDKSLRFLSAACHTAYTFYIGFRDNEIEKMLNVISQHITKNNVSGIDAERVVMYDTFSQDSQGLSMQYLDAIIASGLTLLYISEFNLNDARSRQIKETLMSYPKAKVVTIPSNVKGLKRVQFIYDTIVSFGASKLFIHIHPSAVYAVTAFYALPKEIIKYQINLTDHTYWVGSGCMDYVFDWRQYGASLSTFYRGFREDQILMLPYYPMMKETPFDGFPKEADGKIVIFAGSSYYKVIDEEDTFFKINKAILDDNPQALTLFAGGGDRQLLDNLIEKYGLRNRFVPIGQRNDIFQCFKHSDIYLSTYPLFGGLMGQYAAHAGLPILALQKPGSGTVEESVCQKSNEVISSSSLDDLVREASRLVNDEIYRHQQGERMRNCVVGIDEFNQGFVSAVHTHTSPFPVKLQDPPALHYLNIDDKLKLVNANGDYQKTVYMTLGVHLLCTSPRLWLEGAKKRISNSRLFQ